MADRSEEAASAQSRIDGVIAQIASERAECDRLQGELQVPPHEKHLRMGSHCNR